MLWDTPDTIKVWDTEAGLPVANDFVTVQIEVRSRVKQMFWLAVESANSCVDTFVKRKVGSLYLPNRSFPSPVSSETDELSRSSWLNCCD